MKRSTKSKNNEKGHPDT